MLLHTHTLCNPNKCFCQINLFYNTDDNVYFPDEHKLTEYILNESGCIFSGNHRQIAAMPWFFGQVSAFLLYFTDLLNVQPYTYVSFIATKFENKEKKKKKKKKNRSPVSV